MSNSAYRKLRKQTMVEVEEEAYTIQVEIQTMKYLETIELDALKCLTYQDLYRLRNDLQNVSKIMNQVNKKIRNLVVLNAALKKPELFTDNNKS